MSNERMILKKDRENRHSILDITRIRMRELLHLSVQEKNSIKRDELTQRSHLLLMLYLKTIDDLEENEYPRVGKN